MNYNCNFINLNIIFNTWKTTKSIHVVGAKGLFFAIYTPPLNHVTILYLKKGQSPPQGNEPFFDPFSGTKRHVTVWTNQREHKEFDSTFWTLFFYQYRPVSNCLVSALAKSRAAGRLMRTMAGESRNLQQTWLDSSGNLVVYMSSNAVWPKKH